MTQASGYDPAREFVDDPTDVLPESLRGYLWIDAGRGPFPAGAAGAPVDFAPDDVAAWGRSTLYGDNRTWTVARLRDGRHVCLVLKYLPKEVARFARHLQKSIGTPSAPRGDMATAWKEVI